MSDSAKVIGIREEGQENLEAFFSLVENAPTNIMYCDRDLVIQYVNPKSLETLKSIEHELPVQASAVKGQKIDVFHKDPAHQRKILSNPSNFPIKTTISVGKEKLELLVNGLFNSKKEYIGAQVTWDVVTAKIKNDLNLARVNSMMENAPVNVLLADLDGTIVYVNPKSVTTLRSIEKALPIPVDKIKGGSYDVFHKNPQHQRTLLANDKNLPMETKIKIAEHTLNLLVSPIYDNDKNYIGPMVTWDIITDKLTLIEALGETSSQLASAASELTATATQMAANSEKTGEQSQTASAAAEEVAAGVQNVATNTEEMVSSVKEISRSANESADMSRDTLSKAEQTNSTIKDLGDSSQEIGNVIKVISSIAQQTNLLALNATIEAARAGDAGKGFAVVANEVKELAKQTAKATEDITAKIAAIQGSSSGAVEAIGNISTAIQKMNDIAGSIAAAVEEQTSTTNEVSRIVTESKTGVDGIASTIKIVSEAANDSRQGASQTLEAAKGLTELAEKLKALVDKVEI